MTLQPGDSVCLKDDAMTIGRVVDMDDALVWVEWDSVGPAVGVDADELHRLADKTTHDVWREWNKSVAAIHRLRASGFLDDGWDGDDTWGGRGK